MRFFPLIALTALVGCHQMPIMDSGRVSFRSAPRATSHKVKATCERKGKELHLTIPQDQVGIPGRSGFAFNSLAANPLAMQGMGATGYGPQYRYVPGRTSRALTMGWTALPLPYPRLRKVQIAPTVAMTEGNPSCAFGGGMAGRMTAPYGMPYGVAGMPVAAGGVMPVNYAMTANTQGMSTLQLQQLLAQMQKQQQANNTTRSRAAGDSAEDATAVKKRAAELEKKVNTLLDLIEARQKREGADADRPQQVPGPGYSAPQQAPMQTATNIEQTGGMIPNTAYRTRSDVEMWPHSPQRQ